MKDVNTTVLIHGESGTGKELVAKALHYTSLKKEMPFEAINCAAIPETLLEAELFGYKKGAFTDAKHDRKGLFESCNGGSLFLDEIGELPLNLQSKLLRVLQEKMITPLGSSHSIPVNTRVIAATNKNLHKMLKVGEFREDLYYRLSILQIELPPLRERSEDIPELADKFIKIFSENFNKEIQPFSKELLAKMMQYQWPGNVRELQNSLERAIILSENGEIKIESLFLKSSEIQEKIISHQGTSFDDLKELSIMKEDFEKEYLEKLIQATKGNVSKASRIAGRLRTDMYRLFSKHNIEPSIYKEYS